MFFVGVRATAIADGLSQIIGVFIKVFFVEDPSQLCCGCHLCIANLELHRVVVGPGKLKSNHPSNVAWVSWVGSKGRVDHFC